MQDFYSYYSKLHLQFQVSFNIIAPFRNPEMKMLCHFDPHSRLGAAIKPPPLSNGHTTKLNFLFRIPPKPPPRFSTKFWRLGNFGTAV